MPMLKDPSVKYKAFDPQLKLNDRQWPSKTLTKPPRWLSTDLRDGNQSLPDPMSIPEKKLYFKELLNIGFKEIEVAFPSASQIDFDFTRWCVENSPDDVSIQVLSPCRPELIKRTIESLKGAKRATVHIYLATSDCFRNVVFGMTHEETIEKATECTKLVRELTKDSIDDNYNKTYWSFEFSPETFSDTTPDFALKVCESVKNAWGPNIENPIIFNLPATVEMSTPNVYADQIEYFSRNISNRETICISLHPHNDRGCAVAAAELAQLGGADRVEGCLFGNGERTGNVDLVTLALNLYTQGIYPNLDFSNLENVIEVVEKCNKIPVHPRAPYGGQLVVCAFSGSHQDAIKKGFKKYQDKIKNNGDIKWSMPYLPLDPQDIGRNYEAIIRVNSQSGKGGASWIILRNLELDLPRDLQIDFSRRVQLESEWKGRELKTKEIIDLFKDKYYLYDENDENDNETVAMLDLFKLGNYNVTNEGKNRKIDALVSSKSKELQLNGNGNGPISALANSISTYFNVKYEVIHYNEHTLGKESNSKAVGYIGVRVADNEQIIWGVGIDEDVTEAGMIALINTLNGCIRDKLIRE
ncbi:2-isopropylmalate synthase (Alpha-isopropylmalate synthase) (Alpha-IPM synthetase) [Pichia californica]|nr:2-isopropylmalate synthase (Alpha-isopropylmalate synthase) (Alpha-IPM synthetase) [[Candida] californica]